MSGHGKCRTPTLLSRLLPGVVCGWQKTHLYVCNLEYNLYRCPGYNQIGSVFATWRNNKDTHFCLHISVTFDTCIVFASSKTEDRIVKRAVWNVPCLPSASISARAGWGRLGTPGVCLASRVTAGEGGTRLRVVCTLATYIAYPAPGWRYPILPGLIWASQWRVNPPRPILPGG